MKRGKKAIALETLTWWLIALAMFALVVIVVILLKGKGEAAIDLIKNLFRFR